MSIEIGLVLVLDDDMLCDLWTQISCTGQQRNAIDLDWSSWGLTNCFGNTGFASERSSAMSNWKSAPMENRYTRCEMFANKSLVFSVRSRCVAPFAVHVADRNMAGGWWLEIWRMHECTHIHRIDQFNLDAFRRTDESLQIIESHLSILYRVPGTE